MSRPARYDFKTRPVAHEEAIVVGDKYRFTVLTDGLLRYEWADDGQFEDRASSFAINRELTVPDYYVWDRDTGIEIVTKRFHVIYNKKKFDGQGFTINLKGPLASKWTYGSAQPNNLGGTYRTLDTVDGRIGVDPGILSKDGIAVLDDSKTMLFQDDGWIAPRKDGAQEGNRIDGYIFSYGHDYKEAMRAFYAVSGSQPLLPRFALGNWWSRYHPFTYQEYKDLMAHFDKDDVPISVATIDMDWHLVHGIPDQYPGGGWTGYTWNKDLFPDPVKFMKELHEQKRHITLNVHPADGIRAFEEQYPEVAKYLGIDPSTKAAASFDCTNKDFMDAYFDIVHHEHEKNGVDFWWVDWQQGTQSKLPGIDPLWVLNHFHFLDNGRDQKRGLNFSRYGGPGSHRYPIGFSGDTIMTWNSLNFQPEFTTTSANIGYGWWSHDIGGHMHGYKDDELTARWVQLGCFSPILRLHSSNNVFNTREPWAFNAEACGVMEDALRFRQRLIPYLYTMNARCASDDELLITPLYWDFPETDVAYQYPNQFYYGSELLVAPVTQSRDVSTHLGAVKAWLPPNHARYVDIFTGAVYSGDRELTLHRTLDRYPVLAPEGAIIPLDGSKRPANDAPNPSSFEILLIVGADGSFSLIEDNGTGSHVDEGDFRMIDASGMEACADNTVRFSYTPITYKQETGVLTIGPTSPQDPSIPSSRDWKITLIAYTPPAEGSIRCISTSSKRAKALSFTTQTNDLGTVLNIGSVPSTQTIIIELNHTSPSSSSSSSPSHFSSTGPQLDILDPSKAIWPILQTANMDYDLKHNTWFAIQDNLNKPPNTIIGKLGSMGLKQELLDALLEMLLADSRWADQRAGAGMGMGRMAGAWHTGMAGAWHTGMAERVGGGGDDW